MRLAAKRDANHAAIVQALRKAGCCVLDLGAVGNGCPDLLVQWAGVMTLLEVKNPDKPPSARKLTTDQKLFHAVWAEARLAVVMTPEEAIFAARTGTTEVPVPQCKQCGVTKPTRSLLDDHDCEPADGKLQESAPTEVAETETQGETK